MGRPASGKWRAEPRSEPDSGHPTVRDRRGALGDVTHGEPRNPTRKSKERLWSLLAYRCARPGSIPTTRTSGSVGDWGRQRPWSTRPLDAQARDLVEFPASAAKAAVRCPRVRADRSPADRAAVPPASAPLRRNEPWPTMLRPSFPRLSHPRLAQAIPSIACIAQVYLGGTRGFRPRSRR